MGTKPLKPFASVTGTPSRLPYLVALLFSTGCRTEPGSAGTLDMDGDMAGVTDATSVPRDMAMALDLAVTVDAAKAPPDVAMVLDLVVAVDAAKRGPPCGPRNCASGQVCMHPCCVVSIPDGKFAECDMKPEPICLDVPPKCGGKPTCACGFVTPGENCQYACDKVRDGVVICCNPGI